MYQRYLYYGKSIQLHPCLCKHIWVSRILSYHTAWATKRSSHHYSSLPESPFTLHPPSSLSNNKPLYIPFCQNFLIPTMQNHHFLGSNLLMEPCTLTCPIHLQESDTYIPYMAHVHVYICCALCCYAWEKPFKLSIITT